MSALIAIDGGELKTTADAWSKRLSVMAGELRSKYTITIDVPQDIALRVTWFEGGDSRHRRPARPFTTIQGPALDAAVQALQEHVFTALSGQGGIDYAGALVMAGDALRGVFVNRLGGNGGDLRFASLSRKYAMAKSHKGQGSGIGVATGETLRALSSGRVRITRR